jgi:hypothetical protein
MYIYVYIYVYLYIHEYVYVYMHIYMAAIDKYLGPGEKMGGRYSICMCISFFMYIRE